MSFNNYISSIEPERLSLMVKNGKRSSQLNGHDFRNLIYSSWKTVKETIPELIKANDFNKLIAELFRDRSIGMFESDVDYMDYNEVLYFIFWILDELDAIFKMEQNHLSSEPDSKLIMAGISELNQFGDLNSIDSLAIKYHVSHEEVKSWRYHKVFDLQLKSIIESRIEKKMIELNTPKKGKR